MAENFDDRGEDEPGVVPVAPEEPQVEEPAVEQPAAQSLGFSSRGNRGPVGVDMSGSAALGRQPSGPARSTDTQGSPGDQSLDTASIRAKARADLDAQAKTQWEDDYIHSKAVPASGYKTSPRAYRQAEIEALSAAGKEFAANKKAEAERQKALTYQTQEAMRASGQRFYTDAYGKVQPVLEPETNKFLFHESDWSASKHPKTGNPVLEKRDKYGQRQYKTPPIEFNPDPADEKGYYKMPDGSRVEAGKLEDLANHPDFSVARGALGAIRTRNQYHLAKAEAPLREQVANSDIQYQTAEKEVNGLEATAKDLAQKIAAAEGDPILKEKIGSLYSWLGEPSDKAKKAQKYLDDLNSQNEAVTKQLEVLKPAIKAGSGSLFLSREKAKLDLSIHQNTANAIKFRDVARDIRSQLKAQGKSEEGYAPLESALQQQGQYEANVTKAGGAIPSQPTPSARPTGANPLNPISPAATETKQPLTRDQIAQSTGSRLPLGSQAPGVIKKGAGSAPEDAFGRGNINLYDQPEVDNPKGGKSTVFSRSFNIDGRETLLPSVTPDGRFLATDKEVLDEYKKTGKHLGKFDSPEEANAYAEQLHNDYAEGKYKQAGLSLFKSAPGTKSEYTMVDRAAIDRTEGIKKQKGQPSIPTEEEKTAWTEEDKVNSIIQFLGIGNEAVSALAQAKAQKAQSAVAATPDDELVKIHSRIQDIGKTLDNPKTNIDEKLRASLEKQQDTLTALFDKRYGALPADAQKRFTEATRDPTKWEQAQSTALGMGKAAGESTIDAFEGIARNALRLGMATTPGGTTTMLTGSDAPSEALENGAQQARDWVADLKTDRFNPQLEQKLQDHWTQPYAQGVGGVVPYVAGAGLAGLTGKILHLGDASIAGLVRAFSTATFAASSGNTLRHEAQATLLEKLRSGEITHEKYIQTVGLAELMGSSIGAAASEILPLAKMFSRASAQEVGRTWITALLDQAAKGGSKSAEKWLASGPGVRALTDMAAEGSQFGAFGFALTIANDLAAHYTFDPNRKIDVMKAAESAGTMGFTGIVLGALSHRAVIDAKARSAIASLDKKYPDLFWKNSGMDSETFKTEYPKILRRVADGTATQADLAMVKKITSAVEETGPMAVFMRENPAAARRYLSQDETGRSMATPADEAAYQAIKDRIKADRSEVKQQDIARGKVGATIEGQQEARWTQKVLPKNLRPEAKTVENAVKFTRDGKPIEPTPAPKADPASEPAQGAAKDVSKFEQENAELNKKIAALPAPKESQPAAKPDVEQSVDDGESTTLPGAKAGSKSDYDRYVEIQDRMRVLADNKQGSSDEFNKLWEENEEIKNRNNGDPPISPEQKAEKEETGVAAAEKESNSEKDPADKMAWGGRFSVRNVDWTSQAEAEDYAASEQKKKGGAEYDVKVVKRTSRSGNDTFDIVAVNRTENNKRKGNATLASQKTGIELIRQAQALKIKGINRKAILAGEKQAVEFAQSEIYEHVLDNPESYKGPQAPAEEAAKPESGKPLVAGTDNMAPHQSALVIQARAMIPANESILEKRKWPNGKPVTIADLAQLNSDNERYRKILTDLGVPYERPAAPRGPAIARGENNPTKFVEAALKDVVGDNKEMVAIKEVLTDFSQRLYAANYKAFRDMEVHILSDAEWQQNKALKTHTPDSAGAYDKNSNTLWLNSSRISPENLGSVIAHEGGHFLEKFFLDEAFTQAEWESLTDAQREESSREYNSRAKKSGENLKKDAAARSEWVAFQVARVARGQTKGMSERMRAAIAKFLDLVRSVFKHFFGNENLSTEALDAKILDALGYEKNPPGKLGGQVVKFDGRNAETGKPLTVELPAIKAEEILTKHIENLRSLLDCLGAA